MCGISPKSVFYMLVSAIVNVFYKIKMLFCICNLTLASTVDNVLYRVVLLSVNILISVFIIMMDRLNIILSLSLLRFGISKVKLELLDDDTEEFLSS